MKTGTNYTTFGNWRKPVTTKVDIFGLVLIAASAICGTVLCIRDFSWWTLAGTVFVCGLIGAVLYGTKRWGKGKRTAPVTDTGHHPDLFDGADWTCKHGVKPHKRTMLCAWPIGHDKEVWPVEPTERERRERIDL